MEHLYTLCLLISKIGVKIGFEGYKSTSYKYQKDSFQRYDVILLINGLPLCPNRTLKSYKLSPPGRRPLGTG